jgi:glycolate oxidase iron-sulfur subunit
MSGSQKSMGPFATREEVASYQRSLDCVHCGLCLPACPTYETTGRETSSPRGRIYLMRGLAEGAIDPGAAVTRELDLCLVCRACEPVCPSGVRYGELMEFTRSEILEPAREATFGNRAKRFALPHLIPFPGRLRLLARFVSGYQRLGLRALLRRYGVLRYFGKDLALRDELLPNVPRARERRRLPRQTLSGPGHRGRVGMLEGCVMPIVLGATNRATVTTLAQQGFEVALPKADVCCGALAAHFGQGATARSAAARTIAAFESLGPLEAIVVNSAGCGAAMKEYHRLFEHQGDDDMAQRARAFAAKVRDVSEFLAERGIREPGGRLEAKVAYADACHLAHAQGVKQPPRDLLAAIPGLVPVALERSDRCCGAAGIYNALHPEESLALLDGKIEELKRSGAAILATANPGCLLQYRAGVARAGLDVEVLHPVELFARAIESGAPQRGTPS